MVFSHAAWNSGRLASRGRKRQKYVRTQEHQAILSNKNCRKRVIELIRIAHYKQGEQVSIKQVSKTIETFCELVDGYIEVLQLAGGLLLVCDKEGTLKKKDINLIVNLNDIPIAIKGDFVICRHDGPEFDSLTDDDVLNLDRDVLPCNV